MRIELALEITSWSPPLARRAHRHLVAVRLLDDRDDRPGRPHAAGGRRRSPPASPSRSARSSAACSPSARWRALGEVLHGADDGARLRRRRGDRAGRPRSPSCAATRDRAPGPPPAARALAAGDADAGRRRPLRRPARPRLHDLRAHLRRLRARRDRVRGRRARRSGVAVGLAFGVGRALPVALVAPIADRDAGDPVTELMAEPPGDLCAAFGSATGSRCSPPAAALVVAVPAGASRTEATRRPTRGRRQGTSPSSGPTARASCAAAASDVALPGATRRSATAASRCRRGRDRASSRPSDLQRARPRPAPGADAVAISRRWLVWRARRRRPRLPPRPQTRRSRAARPRAVARPRRPRLAARPPEPRRQPARLRPRDLGRERDRQPAARREAKSGRSRPWSARAPTGSRTRRSAATRCSTSATPAAATGSSSPGSVAAAQGRTLLSRRAGTLWSTALTERAYVTADPRHAAAPADPLRPALSVR